MKIFDLCFEIITPLPDSNQDAKIIFNFKCKKSIHF